MPWLVVCGKCKRQAPVEWNAFIKGWFCDREPPAIRAGHITIVEQRRGEYLEIEGEKDLPLPHSWQYALVPEPGPLCPDCGEDQ